MTIFLSKRVEVLDHPYKYSREMTNVGVRDCANTSNYCFRTRHGPKACRKRSIKFILSGNTFNYPFRTRHGPEMGGYGESQPPAKHWGR